MFTTTQLQTLSNKLTEQLKYQEVYNELYDHFQQAITHRMREGQSFEMALEQVYEEFGKTYGLERIEKDYTKAYKKRYRKLLLKSFRQISLVHLLSLLLCVALLHWLIPFNPKFWLILVVIISMIPMSLYVVEGFRQKKKKDVRLKSLRSIGLYGGSAISHLVVAMLNMSLIIFEGDNLLLDLPQWSLDLFVFASAIYVLAYVILMRNTRNDRIPLTQ